MEFRDYMGRQEQIGEMGRLLPGTDRRSMANGFG